MVKTVVVTGIDQVIVESRNKLNFLMKVKNLPKKIAQIAMSIDGENYEPDCFGFEYTYNLGTKKFMVRKNGNKVLYYLNAEGDRIYMDYDFPEQIEKQAIKKCNALLQKQGYKKKRKSPSKRTYKKEKKNKGNVFNLVLIPIEENKRYHCVSGQLSIFA